MTIANSNKRVSVTASGLLTFTYDFRILTEADLLVILRDTAGTETTQTLTTHYTVAGVGDAGGGTITFLSAPTGTDTVVMILDPPLTQLIDYSSAGPFPADSHELGLDQVTNSAKRTRDLAERSMSLTDGSTPGSGEFDADSQKIINVLDPTLDQDAATQASVNAAIASAVLDPTTTVSAFGATLIDDATAPDALDTLLVTAKAQEILLDATTAAMLGTLDVPAYGVTVVQGASTVAATQALLEVPDLIPGPNMVVNSGFEVWQNGTSFTASAPINDDDTYTADQWILLVDGAPGTDSVDITRDIPTGAVSGYLPGALTATVTATGANTQFGIMQPLSNARSEWARGKTVTLSFMAEAPTGNLADLRFHILSWATAPDVLTSDPISNWNGSTTLPTMIAGWTIREATAGSDTISLTTSWATYSAQFLVPSNCENLAVFVSTNDSAFTSGDTFSISGVKLEAGSVVTPWEPQGYVSELAECERFFTKTFAKETYPVTATGIGTNELVTRAQDQGGSSGGASLTWHFPQRMLSTATVVTYNPVSANANWRRQNIGATAALDAVIEVTGESDRSVSFGMLDATVPNVANLLYYIHATADARL